MGFVVIVCGILFVVLTTAIVHAGPVVTHEEPETQMRLGIWIVGVVLVIIAVMLVVGRHG